MIILQSRRRYLLAIVGICAAAALTSAQVQQPVDAQHSLSEAQIDSLKQIRSDSEKKAAPLALELASTVKQVYENVLSDRENQRLRHRLDRRLHAIAAQLLTIKGQSIRDSVNVLTPDQKQLLKDEMRKPSAPGDLMELIGKVFSVSGN
jgi:Holliday junction resolvasome RuvABC DNA-binding subunit